MTAVEAPPTLTVAIPTLAYDGAETGVAAFEKPVEVRVGPLLSDGVPVGPESLSKYAYFIYRRLNPGAGLDIWDEGAKTWTPEEVTNVERVPTQLAFKADDPEPWQGMIVAAGGRDAGGQPQFAKAAGGYPIYSVRAFFVTADRSQAVVSGPSANVAFVSVSDKNLMVMGPGEGEEVDAATEARVLLKNPALQTIGGLRIERDSPGATVTLDNAAGASIVLHPDGRIEITPAPGQRVVVSGDLETEHITYQPAGGIVKKTLV